MHLLIRKSQHDDGWIFTSNVFELDVRLDLDAEERYLFDKYRLYDLLVYDSDARVQHAYSADESFEAMDESMDGLASMVYNNEILTAVKNQIEALWHLGAGVTHSVISHLSLHITLSSLIEGQHVESESLEEILTVADAIKQNVTYLANYFQLALTFDGREELSEY